MSFISYSYLITVVILKFIINVSISFHIFIEHPLKQLLVQLSTPKSGVAIVVSNDYDNNTVGLLKLSGAHKDAAKMLATFSKLEYAVYHCKNMTYDQLNNIVDKIALLLSHISFINLVFVFSGYGKPGKVYVQSGRAIQLYTQEGLTFDATKLLDFFASIKNPKIFLFNLCHSTLQRDTKQASLMPEKFFGSNVSPDRDNMLVACSALPYKELHSGSLWIEILANHILTQSKDITILLDDVNLKLDKLYHSLFGEPPKIVNMLTEPLNIFAESLSLSGNFICAWMTLFLLCTFTPMLSTV